MQSYTISCSLIYAVMQRYNICMIYIVYAEMFLFERWVLNLFNG